ncbi:MAG: hypothetical protein MR006_00510 [Arcanobacterium sp.]|nr:hypothetical protein [Arcanobacterium sp.]MDY5588663.1 hypothetical protein [Arcanobacterium sp.]
MSSRKRYVVLTPFAQTEVVAGVAALHGIEADVVATQSGAVLVRDVPVPTFDDWDISELLGVAASDSAEALSSAAAEASEKLAGAGALQGDTGVREEPSQQADLDQQVDDTDPFAVAAVFSRLSPYGVVLFQAELGDDVGGEDGVSGLVSAQRVIGGKAGEELHAGLLLNSLDPELEDLVLGLRPIDEIDPHVIHPEAAQALVRGSSAAGDPADSADPASPESAASDSRSSGAAADSTFPDSAAPDSAPGAGGVQ